MADLNQKHSLRDVYMYRVGLLFGTLQEDVRRKAVIESLVAFFGDKASNFLEYREKIWDLEPYNDGAPVSIVGPGAMRYYSRGLRIPFDK